MILSLGHSVRPQEQTLALLQENHVALLVDVRAFPRSRRNPQYNSDAFARALQEIGIGYRHLPALGGMRTPRPDSVNLGLADGFRGFADYMQTAEFEAALSELIALTESKQIAHGQLAVLCAEAKPVECHRSLISDALSARGVEVRHIIGPGLTEPHTLTRSAEVQGTRVSYPFGLIG
ncbi:MAG TPA: DUF488 domain-containing protein [Gammaproteobacteria bacterium]